MCLEINIFMPRSFAEAAKDLTLPCKQLGPAQIAIRMAMAVFVAGAIGLAIFTILGRLS